MTFTGIFCTVYHRQSLLYKIVAFGNGEPLAGKSTGQPEHISIKVMDISHLRQRFEHFFLNFRILSVHYLIILQKKFLEIRQAPIIYLMIDKTENLT